jgi:glycosyltransferase involved in cell wall biosynthesis
MFEGGLRTKNKFKPSRPNAPVVTVVTVVRNGATTLETTMLSVLNQTYCNIEYIVIDGASTDGTLEIIKKYEDRIDYWMSEPDNGIYDAMNKGINLATGDWINFMNSGDWFTDNNVVGGIFSCQNFKDIDVIYGNSTQINDKKEKIEEYSRTNVDDFIKGPIYRHGASFVKTVVHRAFLFDMSKLKKFDYALDFYCIFSIYMAGKHFMRVNTNILTYQLDGMSNHPIKNVYYQYAIISSYCHGLNILAFFLLRGAVVILHEISLFAYCYRRFRRAFHRT